MMNQEDLYTKKRTSILKRIVDYDDLLEREEYTKLERERTEDNVIKRVDNLEIRINEINTKLDAILFAINTLLHSQTNGNSPNSKKKAKVDNVSKRYLKSKIRAKERRLTKVNLFLILVLHYYLEYGNM